MDAAYDLEVITPPCDPGSPRLVAKAHLAADIAPVLTYLNATLTGACYLPEAPALTWETEGHAVVFHPHEIAVGDVEDRADAARIVDDLLDLVNRTWERRDRIVPSAAALRRPTPLAIYRRLPGTNCGECGLPTCWQFALRLVAGQAAPDECPHWTPRPE